MNDAIHLRNALGEPVRPALAQAPAALSSLADYEAQAIHHLPAATWHHVQGGCDQGLTLCRNREAFDALQLLPQPLADLRHAHTGLGLLGQSLQSPILLAPVAYLQLAHPEGELAMVRAATAMQTGWLHSTLASMTMQAVADEAENTAQALGQPLGQRVPRWFQLYAQAERHHTLSLVRRAEAAGYTAVVWTVDAAFKRSDFALPPGMAAANLCDWPRQTHTGHVLQGQGRQTGAVFGSPLVQQAPTWEMLDWLRSQTQLPIVVKGVLSPQVARQALQHGADALIVSNHGGRVLDGVPAPIEVLPAIAQEVAGRVPLVLDSGVRLGTDVLKALALGAQAVLIGRPQVHALAVAGWLGLVHALHLLRTEFELAMALTGCATVADIGPQVLWQPAR